MSERLPPNETERQRMALAGAPSQSDEAIAQKLLEAAVLLKRCRHPVHGVVDGVLKRDIDLFLGCAK